MALKTYNGFVSAQRMRALHWLNREYAAGRRVRPTCCEVCGQTEGVIQAHSEDYSEPFGDHIGKHSLCFRCHMMVHCRFRNVPAWNVYRTHVREGRVFEPIGRSFFAFMQQTVGGLGEGVAYRMGEPKARTFLDELT